MDVFIIAVIVVTATIQSIFGIGVLLFGTPLLLLLLGGYDFVNALTVLLPISLLINLFQIVERNSEVNWATY